MKIQVLGPGCHRCKELAANAEKAVQELGILSPQEIQALLPG